MIFDDYLQLDLDPSREGTITDITQIPDDILAQAQQLNDPEKAEDLLMYYTAPKLVKRMAWFAHKVFVQGQSPHTLFSGGILSIWWPAKDRLTLPLATLIAPLGMNSAEITHRFTPARTHWDAGARFVGAPAQNRPELDYQWTAPSENVVLHSASPLQPLEPIDNLQVAMRRWIATALAFELIIAEWNAGGDVETMLNTVDININECTADGMIAAQALLREMTELPLDEVIVPGFMGPDSWYTSPES